MKLFSNESVLSTSDDHSVHLTNIRIRYSTKTEADSMLLENIQSVSVRHSSIPLFLVLGCIFLAFSFIGLANGNMGQSELVILGTGIVISCVLLFAYLFTQRHYLVIAAGGGKPMHLMIKGQSKQRIMDFIDLLEEAICRRKQELYSRQ